MDIDEKRCSLEVDLAVYRHNYKLVHDCLPAGTRLMAILKSNAYGMGAEAAALAVEDYPDDQIGVATLGEVIRLRDAGIRKEILILGYTPPEYAEVLAKYDATQAIISADYGRELATEAAKAGVTVKCHLALDTGMSRIGLLAYGPEEDKSFRDALDLYGAAGLRFTGIFTHFSSAYGHTPEDEAYTANQYRVFTGFIDRLRVDGIDVGIRHCCNTPSIINYPQYALDMCRGGTLLFGFFSHKDMNHEVDLRLACRFRARIALVKTIEAGTPVSYGRTWTAPERTKIAVISAGWYDGYPRLLGNKGIVLIHGQRCRIAGRVCMDLCMADVSKVPDVKEGDDAVLFGPQDGDTVEIEELAVPLGVGPGSIGGGISERVPRIYVNKPAWMKAV